ncbi:MAG: hypothetical protein INH37_21065, partial [Myxococcaceae bacterium]|nr:hypothetical protein [Myxococcaceae bacterium]
MTAKPGFGVVVALALVSGCSVVKAYTVRDDWATVDRAKVKRLVVVVQPL